MAKRWYVVHVYSGFEKKIAQQLKEQAAQKGLADQFDEVLVPSEQVVEMRRGQKVNAEHKFFPGYVLVKMELTDDAWHLVKNTPKVTGFLGSKTRPSPISEAEAERIMKQTQEGVERPRPAVLFEVGEQVLCHRPTGNAHTAILLPLLRTSPYRPTRPMRLMIVSSISSSAVMPRAAAW